MQLMWQSLLETEAQEREMMQTENLQIPLLWQRLHSTVVENPKMTKVK